MKLINQVALLSGAALLASLIFQIQDVASAAASSSRKAQPEPFQRISSAQSYSTRPASDEISAVIPSPNEPLDADMDLASLDASNPHIDDIIRKFAPSSAVQSSKPASRSSSSTNNLLSIRANTYVNHAITSDSKAVPVYVSPFVRPQSSPQGDAIAAKSSTLDEAHLDESHESPTSESKMTNYATPSHDLKTSASYGHHGYEHGHKGWLDMGAYTGGKGSFGWYADYPVGGKKHHYGYHGRR